MAVTGPGTRRPNNGSLPPGHEICCLLAFWAKRGMQRALFAQDSIRWFRPQANTAVLLSPCHWSSRSNKVYLISHAPDLARTGLVDSVGNNSRLPLCSTGYSYQEAMAMLGLSWELILGFLRASFPSPCSYTRLPVPFTKLTAVIPSHNNRGRRSLSTISESRETASELRLFCQLHSARQIERQLCSSHLSRSPFLWCLHHINCDSHSKEVPERSPRT
jgi:hypothetical protein